MKRLVAVLLLAACSGSPVPAAETGTSSAATRPAPPRSTRRITKSTTAAQLRVAEIKAAHNRRMKELETQSKELLIELESRQSSDKAATKQRLRKETGKELTQEQLDDRLLERLREQLDTAVEARLTRASKPDNFKQN